MASVEALFASRGKALKPHLSNTFAFFQSSNAMPPSCAQVIAPPPHAWAITGFVSQSRMTRARKAISSATLSIVNRRKSV